MWQCWLLFLVVAQAAANQTTYSGFLIDLYCYGRVRAGGLALDGTDVIKDPAQHTLHCLRDPPQCTKSGFYLAVNRGASGRGDYHIKFKLDDLSNQRALAVLRTYPVGHPRDHAPGDFKVTATGTTNGDGILRDASIVECVGAACDGVCQGPCETPLPDEMFKLDVPPLIWGHALFMIASWGCLLPLGVVWARNLRKSDRRFQGHPLWFAGHRLLQSSGWFLQLCGFGCILAQKSGGTHFHAPHEILGLIVVIVGTLQPVNAQLRHLKSVGHPAPDGTCTLGRKLWELLHKGAGCTAVGLGVVNIVFGVFYANGFGFGGEFVAAMSTLTAISLGFLLPSAIALELRRRLISK